MQPGLVSPVFVGRGAELTSMLAALESGQIFAAVLDVFEEEPPGSARSIVVHSLPSFSEETFRNAAGLRQQRPEMVIGLAQCGVECNGLLEGFDGSGEISLLRERISA